MSGPLTKGKNMTDRQSSNKRDYSLVKYYGEAIAAPADASEPLGLETPLGNEKIFLSLFPNDGSGTA